MKLFKIYSMLFILMLLVGICQTSLFGGVKPGTYNVTIKVNSTESIRDTWIFSKNGTFESEGLGIKSEWEDTNDGFEVKTDKLEIQETLKKYYKLVGFSTSDISISIKNTGITGTSKGSTIKGNIETDFSIKVKKPMKTTFTTSGKMRFNGSL